MADYSPLNFLIGLDVSDLDKQVKDSQAMFQEIGDKAIAEGKRIDQMFKNIGKFSTSGFDTSTFEGRLSALREAISTLENKIERSQQEIDEWAEKAKEAFANNDTSGLENAANQIMSIQKAMVANMAELDKYKTAMRELQEASGNMGNLDHKAPNLWFTKQKFWEDAEKTKQKIAELKAKLADLDPNDTKGFDKFNTQLQEAQEHLDNLNDRAANAASELGDKLGGKVSSAAEKYYLLNKALAEQARRYKEAAKEEKEAKKELDRANDSKDDKRIKAASLAYAEAAKNMHEAARAQSQLSAETKDAKENLDKLTGGTFAKLLGGTKNYHAIIDAMPAPLQSVVSGIGGMTKGAKAFLSTGLGLVLGALVLAFKAVKAALTSTEEGQLKLAKATGYLKGVLTVFRGIVVKVGNAIIDMVTKPQEKIKELGDKLTTYIVEPIQGIWKALGGVGKMVKAVLNREWDSIPDIWENMKSEMAEAVTPIATAAKGLKDDITSAGEAMSRVEEQRLRMQREEEEFAIRRERLQAEAEEKRTDVMDTSLPIKQRKKAFEEYKKLLDDIYREELSFANRKVAMQRTVVGLSPSADNKDELRRLQADAAKIQTEYSRQQRQLQRTANSLYKEELSYINKIADETLAMRRKQQQDEINMMEDGLDKTLQQLKLNHQKELDEIDKQRRDIEQKQKAPLDMFQLNEYYQRVKASTDLYTKQMKDALDKELAQFRTYNEQRQKIAEEYARKIEALYEHDEEGNRVGLKQGVSAENVANVVREKSKKLSDIDSKEFKQSADYARFFTSYLVIGAEKVRELADKVKNDLNKQLQEGNITIDQWADGMNKVEEILRKSTDTMGEFKALIDGGLVGLRGYQRELAEQKVALANNEYQQAQQDYNTAEAKGDVQAMRAADARKMSALLLLEAAQAERDAAQEQEQAAKDWASTADIIASSVDVMQSALGSIKDVAESFGVDTDNAAFDYAGAALDTAAQGASAALKFMTGDFVGGIKDAISAVASLITGINAAGDATHERLIKEHMENVEGLQDKYEDLEKAVNKAYGSDKAAKIREQEENLRQQIAELEQARREENEKKNSDDDKLEEYNDKIDGTQEKLEALKQAELDAIFGSDIQSAIESLADGIADAWSNGETTISAFKDFTKKQLTDLLNEYVRKYINEMGYADTIRRKLEEAWGDEKITDEEWEGINAYAEQAGQEMEDALKPIMDRLRQLGEQERTAGTRGVAQASQDSVNELNGRFTAIQGHTFSLKQDVSSIARGNQMLLSVSNSILGTIRNIDRTTLDTNAVVRSIREECTNVRRDISQIVTNGIRLR